MSAARSAGIVVFRGTAAGFEVLLGHMGGPLWARRDARAWSFPKGEYVPPEEPLDAARREFGEELGLPLPTGPLIPLGTVRQRGGKEVTAWALEGDPDLAAFAPGTFALEWPRGSGRTVEFPELDRVRWCDPDTARRLLVAAQTAFVDRLEEHLRAT